MLKTHRRLILNFRIRPYLIAVLPAVASSRILVTFLISAPVFLPLVQLLHALSMNLIARRHLRNQATFGWRTLRAQAVVKSRVPDRSSVGTTTTPASGVPMVMQQQWCPTLGTWRNLQAAVPVKSPMAQEVIKRWPTMLLQGLPAQCGQTQLTLI